MTLADAAWARTYWLTLVPIFGLMCIVAAWKDTADPNRMVVRQTLHWLSVGLAIILDFSFLQGRGEQTAAATGLSSLLILALGCLLAGIHLDWLFAAVGLLLFVMLIIFSIAQEYLVLAFLAGAWSLLSCSGAMVRQPAAVREPWASVIAPENPDQQEDDQEDGKPGPPQVPFGSIPHALDRSLGRAFILEGAQQSGQTEELLLSGIVVEAAQLAADEPGCRKWRVHSLPEYLVEGSSDVRRGEVRPFPASYSLGLERSRCSAVSATGSEASPCLAACHRAQAEALARPDLGHRHVLGPQRHENARGEAVARQNISGVRLAAPRPGHTISSQAGCRAAASPWRCTPRTACWS